MIGKDVLTETPKGASALEFIVFRGILRANLRFEPLWIHSTIAAGRRPEANDSEYFIELRDEENRPVNREQVAATEPVCNPTSGYLLIDGRMGIREGATQLLFFKRDILIAGFPIAAPPELTISFDLERVTRSQTHELRLKYSDPAPNAFMQILYEWTEGRCLTLAMAEPSNSFRLDFSSLPAGEKCRLIVAYTSGLRTTVAKTRPFSLSDK